MSLEEALRLTGKYRSTQYGFECRNLRQMGRKMMRFRHSTVKRRHKLMSNDRNPWF